MILQNNIDNKISINDIEDDISIQNSRVSEFA